MAENLTRQIVRDHLAEGEPRSGAPIALLCGGLLEYLRRESEEPGSESGQAGEGTGAQREEREQGVGGRAE